MKIGIVGAGFSGAVTGHLLAQSKRHEIHVFDTRPHVAGNCHTRRDEESGVMEHVYGPHIFHTSNQSVWDFVNQFSKFKPFINRVKAVTPRGLFGLPINLMTINQFFGKNLRPAEAKIFIDSLSDKTIVEPKNFEEQALRFVGKDLYEAFFSGYTWKQWGCDPKEIPASVLQRLPIRFNYDDNYYNSSLQGIPEDGYTAIVSRMLSHPNIHIELNTKIGRADLSKFDHVVYTGPIDEFYGYSCGRLSYRTVFFKRECTTGDYLGNAVINYTSRDVPHTRIHEHKHFTPWESHEKSLVLFEYSKETSPEDVPYYPVRKPADKAILDRYLEMAKLETNVSFLGRLATYRYLDMHLVIEEAMNFSKAWFEAEKTGSRPPILPKI